MIQRRGSAALPIRTSSGHVVGMVKGGVFRKSIIGSRHLLKVPPAIAFDTSTLLDAQRAGAMWAEVTDTETSKVYRASVHMILRYGFTLNRGHGAQVALELDRWTRDGEPCGLQLAFSFFGGAR